MTIKQEIADLKVEAHNLRRQLKDANENLRVAILSLRNVSFYARINHGDKAKDYGEVVNPTLKKLGQETGEL